MTTNSRARDYHLRRKFGITLQTYNEILKKQNGKCAVCKKPKAPTQKNFAVDHDHVTQEIRGLLCFRCNKFVIGRHRDPELLQSATDYLRQGTGLFVPPSPKKKTRRKRKKGRS